jgi:hypothetical protein
VAVPWGVSQTSEYLAVLRFTPIGSVIAMEGVEAQGSRQGCRHGQGENEYPKPIWSQEEVVHSVSLPGGGITALEVVPVPGSWGGSC